MRRAEPHQRARVPDFGPLLSEAPSPLVLWPMNSYVRSGRYPNGLSAGWRRWRARDL